MRIAKEQMSSAGKEQEGAALLLSRMLLRLINGEKNKNKIVVFIYNIFF